MYFGVDYYPEHWIFPYAGTAENPTSRWLEDAQMMVAAGINVVRMGEMAWGLFEPSDEKYDFDWMYQAMDILGKSGIKIILGTPTAAPPLWLAKKYPEILPLDDKGHIKNPGTRRACCLNNSIYWEYCSRLLVAMSKALGKHPHLIAWQIDNAIGGHLTESSFNPETKRDWHAWLKAKYETIEHLNEMMGMRFWGQVVSDWDEIPMPLDAPTLHNPALHLDWMRFSSDTIVAFVRMQADLLRELTPGIPVTTNMRALTRNFDHFDVAEVIDFVSVDSNATIGSKSAEFACEMDIMRSLKKNNIKSPSGNCGFWVVEQKAGHVDWQEVNSLVRPGVARLFTYQLLSRGANGILYYLWRQPRFGSAKFFGGGARS